MSHILQPGQHPDADQLNAFVEHGLPLHEQQQTLAHLANCAECRAIVYLAQPASPGDSTQLRPIAERKPWFSGWNLAWPAAAALACLIMFTVHLHNTGRGKREAASITIGYLQPPPRLITPYPAQGVPPEPASIQVQESLAAVAPSSHVLDAKAATNAINVDKIPQRRSLNGLSRSPNSPAIAKPEVGAASPSLLDQQSIRGAISATSFQPANSSPTPSPIAGSLRAKPSPQAETNISNSARMQLRDASAAPQRIPSVVAVRPAFGQQLQAARAPSLTVSPSVAPASAGQTTVVTEAVSIEPESIASSRVIAGAATGRSEPGRPSMLQEQLLLPSHLPALSTISNARHKLAIDTVGALFRSEDAGVTWQPVPPQWTGRAVKVSLALSPNKQMAARDTRPVTPPPAAAKSAVAVPVQPAGFELTTDTGDFWISADGQVWRRR